MRRFRSRRFAVLMILMLVCLSVIQGTGIAFGEDIGVQEQPPYSPGDGSSAKITNPPYTEGNYNTEPKYDLNGGTADGVEYWIGVGSGKVYFKFSSNQQRVEWWSTDIYMQKVIVKGGDGYFTYDYSGKNALNDQNLRAPNNNGGQIPRISHISFVGGQPAPQEGSLEITKEILWGDSTPVAVDGFQVTVTGMGDIQFSAVHTFMSNDEKWLIEHLTPGQYQITESDSLLWEEVITGSPATVTVNQKTTVTVTNTYTPPQPGLGALKVTKQIDMGDAVVAAESLAFEITITGPSYPSGSSHTFSHSGDTFTWINLIPGDYWITEGDQVEWIEEVPSGVVPVEANATSEVTVTNRYDPIDPELGTLTVNKTFVGGTVTSAEFTLYDGALVVAGPLTTDSNGQVVFYNLELDKTYRLVETAISNYSSSIGAGVDILVNSDNKDVILAVVNTFIPPTEPGGGGGGGGGGTTTVTAIERDRADAPVEVVPPEPVPLGAPTIEEPVTLPEEIVPLAVPVLPKTGELPANLFYGLGGLITAVGAFLKRK